MTCNFVNRVFRACVYKGDGQDTATRGKAQCRLEGAEQNSYSRSSALPSGDTGYHRGLSVLENGPLTVS